MIKTLVCSILFLSSQWAFAFQVKPTVRHPTQLYVLSVAETTPREYGNFAAWSEHYGLVQENGFQLTENYGDWSVMATQPAQKGSRVLFVPSMLIMSSQRVRQEEFTGLEPIMQFLDEKGATNLIPQFFLWLKVMKEYEIGEQSPYYPWFDALPRKYSTAISFDDFEMTCLPPFVGSLARIDRINFGLFLEALQGVNGIDESTKSNLDVVKWAFNVVFTRCWANAISECEVVPMADMFNHASDANVVVQYDDEGNCNVVLTRDVQQGEPLCLSYGNPTNPSRFLSTFGFLDQSPPATFCKIMTARPSKELKNLGYDFSRMVFYVQDGAIAEEVWDVMLYSLLEGKPQVRQDFYDAHMRRDRDAKVSMHAQYLLETCTGILTHVDTTLQELATLSAMMDREGPAGHDNLEMIRAHNDFVCETFMKVKLRLDRMIVNEKGRREVAV